MSKLNIQTGLDDYEVVEEQVKRSKIYRIPYKKIIGESLTSYCYRNFDKELSSSQVLARLIRLKGISALFAKANQKQKQVILKNLKISVSSRHVEWNRFN